MQTQLHKLTDAVSLIQSEMTAESIPEQQEEKVTSGRLLLAPLPKDEPFVFCPESKPISNLNFSLQLATTPNKNGDVKRLLYFVSESGEELCPRQEISFVAGKETRVSFSLNASASSLEKCYLVVKASEHSHNEAYQLLEFFVKIAFSVEFDF